MADLSRTGGSSSDSPRLYNNRDKELGQHARKGQAIPQWLPVTLLAVTTAALAVPFALLRKQRASVRNASPPVRRSAIAPSYIPRPRSSPPPCMASAPPHPSPREPSITSSTSAKTSSPESRPLPTAPSQSSDSDRPALVRALDWFAGRKRPIASGSAAAPVIRRVAPSQHAPRERITSRISAPQRRPPPPKSEAEIVGVSLSAFDAFRAFAIATAIVTTGAAVTVWGVTSALGVHDMPSFTARMRQLFGYYLPTFASRIRPVISDDDRSGSDQGPWTESPPFSGTEQDLSALATSNANPAEVEFETRLAAAYNSGGWSAWADEMRREFEEEKAQRNAEQEEHVEG